MYNAQSELLFQTKIELLSLFHLQKYQTSINQFAAALGKISNIFSLSTSEEIVPLKESPIYTEDRIGLKALDEAGKLFFLETEGDHMEFETGWFVENIVKVYFQ